jgi:flagellar biosynthesis component FlhA
VEEIRSLPEIRKQLPGNSLQEPAVIRSLNRDLEDRIYRTIDWNRSEPMVVSGSPEIRQEVRLLALNAKTEAGKRGAVLLTSSAVRPFARKMVVDIDVNVLSRREIFPELLSRI